MTCPDPIPGSVTNETGALTGLVDAYSDESGAPFQHQLYATLTNKPNACTHYRQNQIVANEAWLIITQIAWNPDNSTAAPWSGAMTINVGGDQIGSDGITHYTCTAAWAPHSSRCKVNGQKEASSGSVAYTQADTTIVAGHYDLWFGADHLTGDFIAPKCALCPPRPTTMTCLSA